VLRQQPVRVSYKGMHFEEAFRADLIVDEQVLVELKATSRHEPVFARQLLTYLRLRNLSVGLLINFGGPTLLSGVRRIVNRHTPDARSRLRINGKPHPIQT
jgi:iron complex transport system substrate-binding protein